MKTSKSMLHYLAQAIKSFDADPPTTQFQRGYLAALKECMAVLSKGNPPIIPRETYLAKGRRSR